MNEHPESLEKPLRELLRKNGVTAEGLEKAVLVQKAALAAGISSREDRAMLVRRFGDRTKVA